MTKEPSNPSKDKPKKSPIPKLFASKRSINKQLKKISKSVKTKTQELTQEAKERRQLRRRKIKHLLTKTGRKLRMSPAKVKRRYAAFGGASVGTVIGFTVAEAMKHENYPIIEKPKQRDTTILLQFPEPPKSTFIQLLDKAYTEPNTMDGDEWVAYAAITSSRLEGYIKYQLEILPEKKSNLHDLLKQAQKEELFDKSELDRLHDYRMHERNELIHARKTESIQPTNLN